MKYKVSKKFFDPFLQKRMAVGDMVEVTNEHLESYRPYIEIPGAPKEEVVEKKAPTIEEAKAVPPMLVTERPKKKAKGGK